MEQPTPEVLKDREVSTQAFSQGRKIAWIDVPFDGVGSVLALMKECDGREEPVYSRQQYAEASSQLAMRFSFESVEKRNLFNTRVKILFKQRGWW